MGNSGLNLVSKILDIALLQTYWQFSKSQNTIHMNILLVTGPNISLKQPFQSGIEAFVVSFADHLIYKGHNVDVVAGDADSSSKFNIVNPFRKSTVNHPTYYRHKLETSQFEDLDTDIYDIIHYNMFYPHLIKVGMFFKKKSFLSLHSPAYSERILVFKKLFEEEDLTFVAISQRIKRQYDAALQADIPLINNGIQLDDWHSTTSRKSRYLLWSARITKEKNVVDAIKLANGMGLDLKIVGRIVDKEYFECEVQPQLKERIQYMGHVSQNELRCLSQGAIAYLATATWQEPFGLAALEMLASGIPVIGYDTAVPQEWEHESVLKTGSMHWQDLVGLVEQSETISSESCRVFASSMSIEQMTLEYLQLFGEETPNNRVALQL